MAMMVSCMEDQINLTDPDDYFPLTVGMYQVYDVQEITYSAFAPPQARTYQLRQEIVDFFTNGEGNTTYVMHRSTRQQQTDNWTYVNTWSAYRSAQYRVVQEENVKLVKLIAPMQVGNKWNGNIFNTLGDDEYRVESMGKAFHGNTDISFDNTVVVNQSDERTLLFQDERKEVYAFGIGLAYKESNVIQFSTSGGLPGTDIIGGYYAKQVLREYGKQ
jgi:hypothetical protein